MFVLHLRKSEQRTCWIEVDVVDDPSYSLHTNASTVANTSGQEFYPDQEYA